MPKTQKKIIVSINTSWNIFNFRLNLIKHFQKLGYQVIALAPEDAYSQDLIRSNVLFESIIIDNKGHNPIKDLYLLKQYYSLLKKHRPDIALFFTIKPNIYGTIAATYLKIPVINNVSGLGTAFIHKNWIGKVAQLLYKISFRYSSKVFFQNKDDQELFIKRNLVSTKKAALLPGSGVDLKKFTAKPLPSQLNILFIGRLLYDKGIIEYLESCKALKKKYNNRVTFSIVGKHEKNSKTGISKKKLGEYIKEEVVTYLGTTDQIQEEIAKASVIILPSYREGTPRSLLEGAAMGRPLIATNVPGCKDLITENYNGWLCKAKSVNELTSTIEKVINTDEKKLRKFGSNSRTFVAENYGEQRVFKKHDEAFKEIL